MVKESFQNVTQTPYYSPLLVNPGLQYQMAYQMYQPVGLYHNMGVPVSATSLYLVR